MTDEGVSPKQKRWINKIKVNGLSLSFVFIFAFTEKIPMKRQTKAHRICLYVYENFESFFRNSKQCNSQYFVSDGFFLHTQKSLKNLWWSSKLKTVILCDIFFLAAHDNTIQSKTKTKITTKYRKRNKANSQRTTNKNKMNFGNIRIVLENQRNKRTKNDNKKRANRPKSQFKCT